MSEQRALLDELFNIAMILYVKWVMVRLYALSKAYEKLNKEMQKKIKDNIDCKWGDEKMMMLENIKERIRKGDEDDELIADIIAMFACLAHAFRTAGLGDIVDTINQLTELPNTQTRN